MLKRTGLYGKEGSREYRMASVRGAKEEAERLGRELAKEMKNFT